MDYHITVDGCSYSVLWQLAGKEVELQVSIGTIEVLHNKGERVARHAKSHGQAMVIKPEHMEEAHHLPWIMECSQRINMGWDH